MALTKPREKEIGADWEWWFVGRQWRGYPMRVQAKRINIKKQSFGHLWHHARNASANQMDTLIRGAKAGRRTPIYCFYTNHFGAPSSPRGCLLAHAEIVRRVDDARLQELDPFCIPWYELVCPGENGERSGLATIAAKRVRALVNANNDEFKGRDKPTADDLYIAEIQPLPDFLRLLAQGAIADSLEIARGTGAGEKGVRGYFVVGPASG